MTVIARTVDPKNFIKNHIYNMGFYTQTPYIPLIPENEKILFAKVI